MRRRHAAHPDVGGARVVEAGAEAGMRFELGAVGQVNHVRGDVVDGGLAIIQRAGAERGDVGAGGSQRARAAGVSRRIGQGRARIRYRGLRTCRTAFRKSSAVSPARPACRWMRPTSRRPWRVAPYREPTRRNSSVVPTAWERLRRPCAPATGGVRECDLLLAGLRRSGRTDCGAAAPNRSSKENDGLAKRSATTRHGRGSRRRRFNDHGTLRSGGGANRRRRPLSTATSKLPPATEG